MKKLTLALIMCMAIGSGCRSNKTEITNKFTAYNDINVNESGQKVDETLAADKDFGESFSGNQGSAQ